MSKVDRLRPDLPWYSHYSDWIGGSSLRGALVQQRVAQRQPLPIPNNNSSSFRPTTERPLIQRVLDVITAPLAGVTEMFEEGIAEEKESQGLNDNDTLTFLEGLRGLGRGLNNFGALGRGAGEALRGEPDYGGEVIRDWLGAEGQKNIDTPLERMGIGTAALASDIALDPLTYVPFGAVSKLARTGSKAIPEQYLARGADELAATTNPNLPKQLGRQNRSVRVRDNMPEVPAGQRVFEAGPTPGSTRVIRPTTTRDRAAALVDEGMSRPGATPAATAQTLDEGVAAPRINQADVARAAEVPDLSPASVLPSAQIDKINRFANRTVRVQNIATQPQRLVEKYGQRWRQSAINNGQDPVAVEAGWNAVKADVDRMVAEVEEVVRRLPEDQQAAYRQVGLNNIVVDTQKVLSDAASEAMTARELTERIAARRQQGGLSRASEAPTEPVVAGPKSPEAQPINPDPAPVETSTSAADIGRQLDEAAETAETTAKVESVRDTNKVVRVRPSGKKREQILSELKSDSGPHAKNFDAQVETAVSRILEGHTRKFNQKQINAIRANLKVIIARRLKRMEEASGGRFNQFEQANLWEDIVKFLREPKTGPFSMIGLSWKKEGAKQYLVARDMYLAVEPYLLDAAPGTIWNGVRKNSVKRWTPPTPEQIATGNFSQYAKAPGKGQKPRNLNIHFSFGELLREMPDDILKQVFMRDTTPGPYGVALANAAFWKSKEYLAVMPANVQSWLKSWDSMAHASARAKAYANVQNPAADAAISSTARNMEQSAATKAGPEIMADAQKAENAAATATVAAGGDTATTVKAGKEAKQVADDIAVEAVHGTSTAGRETYRRRKALLNAQKSKRGAKRQAEAGSDIAKAVNKTYNEESLARIKGDPELRGKVAPVNNANGMSIDPTPVDMSFKERLGHWFRTDYKKGTIYPLWQNSYGAMHEIHSSIGTRYNNFALKHLRGKTDAELTPVREALSAFRGLTPVDNLSPAARQVWDDLSGFRDMVGSPEFREFVDATVAGKAGLDMNHVNAWIKVQHLPTIKGQGYQRFFFSEVDEGHWLESIFDPENGLFKNIDSPEHVNTTIREMHALENALMAANSERLFVDDFIARGFGTRNAAKAKEGWVKLESETLPYIDGVYVHPDIGEQAKFMLQFMEDVKTPSKFAQMFPGFDFALRSFKTGVTIYNPQHHIRNAVGDLWLHYADGGKIRHYNTARKIIDKYDYVWRRDQFQVLGAGEDYLAGKAGAQLTGKNRNPIYVKNGSVDVSFNDRDIVDAFHRRGLALPAENIEDLISVSNNPGKVMNAINTPVLPGGGSVRSPFKGAVHNVASNVSMYREHYARLAHFVHAIEDIKVPKVVKKRGDAAIRDYILDNAVRRTRQWHPDGLDLTKAEREVGRRLIPFYSWQRKSLPLVALAAVRRPVLFTYERKISDAMGVASGEQEDYLPGNQLFPTWLRGSALSGSLGMQTQLKEDGSPSIGHRLLQGPGTPGTDALEMLLGSSIAPGQTPLELGKEVLSQSNPIGRVPIEMLGNYQFRTESPISNPAKGNGFFDYAEYLAENTGVPYAGVLTRGATNRNPGYVDLINFLTGASIIDTAGYDTAAQLSEREQQSYLRERRGY